VFTLPAVNRVRASFPKSRISFLVSKEYAPLLKGFRDVDTVLGIDRARFRSGRGLKSIFQEALRLLRALRADNFSLVVDFQGYGETAALTWWTGAAARWGIAQKAVRRLAYTKAIPRDNSIHPADCNLALLRAGGIEPGPVVNRFSVPETSLKEARQFCLELGLNPERPLLFLQPFTSSWDKNWPLQHYLAVAAEWQRRGFQILFGGGPADQFALEPAIEAGFPVSAGVPLLTSAGLAQLSTVLIGGDPGVLHLGIAMSKRVIMIMGGNQPAMTYPFQHPDWQVLPTRGKRLESITIDRVNAACSEALKELGLVP